MILPPLKRGVVSEAVRLVGNIYGCLINIPTRCLYPSGSEGILPVCSVYHNDFIDQLIDNIQSTITTNVGPLAKQDAVLHPEVSLLVRRKFSVLTGNQCKRIITIRELARAQGFPDDFSFHSVNDNVQDVCFRSIS